MNLGPDKALDFRGHKCRKMINFCKIGAAGLGQWRFEFRQRVLSMLRFRPVTRRLRSTPAQSPKPDREKQCGNHSGKHVLFLAICSMHSDSYVGGFPIMLALSRIIVFGVLYWAPPILGMLDCSLNFRG